MNIQGYEIITEWKNSQCGKTAIAQKGGKKYFLKKYQTPVAPIDNGALDRKTFEHNKEMFEKFVATRKGVNAQIRLIAGSGGNIVIPCDEFIDGNQYVEAAELVDGVVPEDEMEAVLSTLSIDVKQLLMQTAAGALYSVHSKKIIHSDLKIKNVLLVKNAVGNYVAKLIDFDSSYFVYDKPEEIVGTIDYYSPELGEYSCEEEPEAMEACAAKITEKSDIFSLGLIYHFYLAGEFPKLVDLTEKLKKKAEKGKVIYTWVALNSGCGIEISPAITSIKYRSLISDMLSINPDDRPTANEVLKRLKEADPVIEEPWPEHKLILDKVKLNEAGIAGLKKINKDGEKKYEVIPLSGKRYDLTRADMISKKLAKAARTEDWAEAWPEHKLVFDIDKLKLRGFVAVERAELAGVHGYIVVRADGTETFFKKESLIAMKYASIKTEPVVVEEGIADPWPEHNVKFDKSVMNSKGFLKLEKQSLNGVNGYQLTRTNGATQFMRIEMLVIQKIAIKL